MIVVVGSLNRDLAVKVPHHPAAGETVLGGDLQIDNGGKGANQAIAAARLGGEVAMIGRVGADAAGAEMKEALSAEGVDAAGVVFDADSPTGTALITVDDQGENAIVVAPGANEALSAEDVQSAKSILTRASVTLIQLEIPLDAVSKAIELSRGWVILNPAPAQPLSSELLERVDVLVPNHGELAVLAGRAVEPASNDDLAGLARSLPGPQTIVVTLGAEGALIVDREGTRHVPSPSIDAVDTTAAGDSFCGALAEALERKRPLPEAVTWAVHAAALTCTTRGAQSSLPYREPVEASVWS